MLKIAHLSDTQIRNYQRHWEFRESYQHLYASLREKEVDLIVVVGDIAHTKTHISPEFVQLCTEYFQNLADIAPTVIVPGNHDGNLNNLSRLDALTPIVEAMKHRDLYYYKNSGVYTVPGGFVDFDVNVAVFSCFDNDWPTKDDVKKAETSSTGTTIGLYHGMVKNAILQNGQVVEDCPYALGDFLEICDFLMMGDIHRQQIFAGYRAAYCGSYPQQNFGESINKGYLLWEIESKDKWDVDFVKLHNVCPFYTIELDDGLALDGALELQEAARIRVITRQLTVQEEQGLRSRVNELYKPREIYFKDQDNAHLQEVKVAKSIKIEDLTNVGVQEKLIKKFLKQYGDSYDLDKIFELNKIYDALVKKQEDIIRNVQYKYKRMKWDNLLSYGEGNEFDFGKHRGIVGVFGKNGTGKALDLKTEIPTVDGWKTIESVQVGDFVFGDNGVPTKIVAKSPVYRNRICYEVTFSDGEAVVCDADHLWTVQDHFSRIKKLNIYQTLTTRNLRKLLKWRNRKGKVHDGHEWSVDVARPVQYCAWYGKTHLPVHPYVLGCWLGDGTSSSSHITTEDRQIIENIQSFGESIIDCEYQSSLFCIKGLQPRLRQLGVLNKKHIPDDYLYASVEERRALLAGLLDTDGYCDKRQPTIEFCNTNKLLAEQVCELVCSLGFKTTIREGNAILNGKFVSKKYRVCFTTNERVFNLSRKRLNENKSVRDLVKKRFIVDIQKTKRRNVQCLVVDNQSRLFLITKKFIPTHNSSLAVDIPLYIKFNTNSKGVVKNDHLINDKKESCSGELEIDIGKNTYKISRNTEVYVKSGKRKGKPVLQGKTNVRFRVFDKDGCEIEDKDGLERGDTDKEIRKIFGTAEDFMATSVSPQWRLLDFLEKKSTDRQKTLGRYFDIDIFQKKYDLAKKDAKDIKADLQAVAKRDLKTEKQEAEKKVKDFKQVLKELERQYKRVAKKRETLDKRRENWLSKIVQVPTTNAQSEDDIQAMILRAKRSCLNRKTEVDGLTSEKQALQQKHDKLLKKISAVDIKELEKQKVKYERQTEGSSKLYGELGSCEGRTEQIDELLKGFDQYPCIKNPDCCMLAEKKRLIAEKLSVAETKRSLLVSLGRHNKIINEKLGPLEGVLEEHYSAVETLDDLKRDISHQEELIESTQKLLDKTLSEVKSLEATKQQILENKEQIAKNEIYRQKANAIESEIRPLAQEKVDLSKAIMEQKAFVIAAKKDVETTFQLFERYEALRKDHEAYEYYLRAMGKEGLPKLIIHNNLGLINKQVKKILSGNVNFDIELESNGKEIDILFKHSKSKKRRIELCSGMEKTITAIALRAAMVNVTTLPRANIFVLDEVFASLDPEYVDAVRKILQYLKTLFDSVIIITHLEDFKDIVDHVVEVERDDESFARIL